MVKYKIGDIVKVVRLIRPRNPNSRKGEGEREKDTLNHIGTIQAIQLDRRYPYDIKFPHKAGNQWLHKEKELVKPTEKEIKLYKQELIENEI